MQKFARYFRVKFAMSIWKPKTSGRRIFGGKSRLFKKMLRHLTFKYPSTVQVLVLN